jgi:hypothetical protein
LQVICKIFGFISLLLLGLGDGYAQVPQQERRSADPRRQDPNSKRVDRTKRGNEQLAKYELRDLRNSLLLNKSFFTESEIEHYRHLPYSLPVLKFFYFLLTL